MRSVGRLRGRRTFADLAQNGRTVRSGPVRVRYLAAPGTPAVGYAIGKRVGPAVVRNRIRRRLRAAVAAVPTPLTSGFYLISSDASASEAPFEALVTSLNNAITTVAR